jgi:hypothetical protein
MGGLPADLSATSLVGADMTNTNLLLAIPKMTNVWRAKNLDLAGLSLEEYPGFIYRMPAITEHFTKGGGSALFNAPKNRAFTDIEITGSKDATETNGKRLTP